MNFDFRLQIRVHVNIYNINKINNYILPDGEGKWPRQLKKKLSLCSQSLTFRPVGQDAQQPSITNSTKILTPVTNTKKPTKTRVITINQNSASPAKQVVKLVSVKSMIIIANKSMFNKKLLIALNTSKSAI
jgi:hypothetical protein